MPQAKACFGTVAELLIGTGPKFLSNVSMDNIFPLHFLLTNGGNLLKKTDEYLSSVTQKSKVNDTFVFDKTQAKLGWAIH